MRTIPFFLLLVLISLTMKAQSLRLSGDSLAYFAVINTNDCINCQIALHMLTTSPSGDKITLVFRNKDRRYAPRYIDNFQSNSQKKLQYIVSDSLADKLTDASPLDVSKFIAYRNQKVFFASDLQKVTQEIFSSLQSNNSLPPTMRPDTTAVANLDSIRNLSNYVTISSFDRGLTMADYSFGTAYAFFFKNKLLIKYGPQQLGIKQAYMLYFGDSLGFTRSVRPILAQLKQIHKEAVRAENIIGKGDTTFVLYSFTFPSPGATKRKDDIVLSTKYLLAIYLHQKLIQYYCIPEEFANNYYLSPGITIGRIRKSFIFAIGKEDLNAPNYFLVELIPNSSHKLIFKRFLPANLPAFFVKDSIVYSYTSGILRSNKFFFHYDNQLFDTSKNTRLHLQIPQHRVRKQNEIYEIDNYLADAIPITEKKYRIIVRQAKNYYSAETTASAIPVNAATPEPALHSLLLNSDTLYSLPVFGPDGALYYLNDRFHLMQLKLGPPNH